MDTIEKACLLRAQAALGMALDSAGVGVAPGTHAGQYIKALAAGLVDGTPAENYAAAMGYGAVIKNAVAALHMGNAGALAPVGADFMAIVRPQTILGRALHLVRRPPLNVALVRQTAGATAQWIQDGHAIGLGGAAFTRDAAMPLLKVAAISVASRELVRATNAEDLLLADLARSCATAMDLAFADPSNGGVPNTKPASVFSGAPSVPSSGSDASALVADFLALLDAFAGDLTTSVLIAHPRTAAALALLERPCGDSVIQLDGPSRFAGLPLYASSAIPLDSGGSIVGLIDLARLEVVGLDSAELSASDQVALLMDDAPNMNSVTPTGASVVSMWQTNSIALMARVFANWRCPAGSAAYIDGVSYGA